MTYLNDLYTIIIFRTKSGLLPAEMPPVTLQTTNLHWNNAVQCCIPRMFFHLPLVLLTGLECRNRRKQRCNNIEPLEHFH